VKALATVLAIALLAATLAWHVPMMLWDHFDLLPLLDAWQRGELLDSGFAQLHGGHLHTSAYALLLGTTLLSGGATWVDCVASWLLLLAYAALVARWWPRDGTDRRAIAVQAGIVFLTLYPGHLANLQWGWQVAVFLCLAATALALRALLATTLDWRHNAFALLAAAVACTSFATGMAVLPAALLLIALRDELPPPHRALLAAPWLLLALVLAAMYLRNGLLGAHAFDAAGVALHALNFLGSGIARFATDLAPWIAAAGLLLALAWIKPALAHRAARPWLALLAFGAGCALLTALGRVQAWGPDQAFATRYASFSSTFWLGLVGIGASIDAAARVRAIALPAVLLLAGANAIHHIKQAYVTGARTRAVAEEIRTSWPQVDEDLLREIYFDDAEAARRHLDALRTRGWAPFHAGPG